jgi:hypothetical protein
MGFNDLNRTKVSPGGSQKVEITGPASAFGEVTVEQPTPVAQGDFVYGIINTQTFTTASFAGGSVSVISGNAVLESGTDPYGSATVLLRRGLDYRPGQGTLMRATALFDTPNTGSSQFIGAGSAESGYFVGYSADQFGVLHTQRGSREARKYTVTAAAGAANLTVTLDGDSIVVPVSASTTYATAYQLSNADYSQVGKGWVTDVCSGSVFFLSARSGTEYTGSYSITGGTITGAFTRIMPGQNQVNDFIPSSSFNIDKLDGSGPTGMIFDPSKGNVFEIGIQYLGYGNAKFGIEDPETGVIAPFHMIKNANARTTTVLKNPNLNILATSTNIGGTQNTALKTASMAAFTEGQVKFYDPKFAKGFSFSGISESSYVPLATFKTNRIFNNQSCFGEMDILRLAGSNETNNKTLVVGLFLDAQVSGDPNFQFINEEQSIVSLAEFDPSNDTFVGSPIPFYELVVGSESSEKEDLTALSFIFGVGRSVTIGIKTSGAVTGEVSVNWFEQQ